MKNYTIVLISILLSLAYSCSSGPKDFTYKYKGEYTGLDKLINIDGYYVVQRECDSAFFSMFMFYPDGLFTIATTSEILPELADCFENGGKDKICKYPSWGTYFVENDTIKTQVIRQEGIGLCTIFRDYKILPDGNLMNISDYVHPENTKIGYMKNYPSFFENRCMEKAQFVPLNKKRNVQACPYIKSKWFKN